MSAHRDYKFPIFMSARRDYKPAYERLRKERQDAVLAEQEEQLKKLSVDVGAGDTLSSGAKGMASSVPIMLNAVIIHILLILSLNCPCLFLFSWSRWLP